ncbi:hypothetical protein H5410_003538 [Solanum commersonii]|uniref:Uncharacterized protein n=1 Tax=Solanum commersonii TaxID=4109 RepID=A0A9J6B4Y9_SOLCO|nr:hypothetical protein H5410_003538 [Solanum commersonii]
MMQSLSISQNFQFNLFNVSRLSINHSVQSSMTLISSCCKSIIQHRFNKFIIIDCEFSSCFSLTTKLFIVSICFISWLSSCNILLCIVYSFKNIYMESIS